MICFNLCPGFGDTFKESFPFLCRVFNLMLGNLRRGRAMQKRRAGRYPGGSGYPG
jgi:hypothetical protein